MRPIPSLTDASESTSMAEIVIGSFSCVAIRASSGARSGLRIVAATWWPALPKASAVAMPIPELVPVIRTEAMRNLLLCEQRETGKAKPATWVSHSAGFAVCSPRDLGEPHDIAPRGHGAAGTTFASATVHHPFESRLKLKTACTPSTL